MRKLAHVETITDILEHPNADKLEIAKVLGWTLCIVKGQFKVGQQVVFIEPDAVLPEGKTEWEFMKDRGYRIKTIRLRGVISQGLIFNAQQLLAEKYFPLCEQLNTNILPCGTDVTELLGITQYQPYIPAQLAGQVKGNFPEFLHKTDEERIQNVPEILERYKGKMFSISEKVDGTSFTAFYKDGEFGVCSRNLELKEDPNNVYWKIALELDLRGRLASLKGNHAIQGELVGMGIQSNKYKLDKVKLFVFNLYNIDKGQYYDAIDLERLIKEMGLETVPMVERMFPLNYSLEEIIKFADAPSILNKNSPREGVVFRSIYEQLKDPILGRLSFKVINPEFLLKYSDE